AAYVGRLGLVIAGSLNRRLQGLMDTHVLETLAGGRLVTVGDEIFRAQRQRIDAELASDLVNVRLQGEHRLRLPRSAHEAARDGISVYERRLDPAVGSAIGSSRLVEATDDASRFEGRIGPRVDQVVHLVGCERAVALDAALERDHDRVPRVAGEKLLDVV